MSNQVENQKLNRALFYSSAHSLLNNSIRIRYINQKRLLSIKKVLSLLAKFTLVDLRCNQILIIKEQNTRI